MKKPTSKDAHNRHRPFFSVLLIGPNPAQISILFHKNLPPRDFSIMTLYPAIVPSAYYYVVGNNDPQKM